MTTGFTLIALGAFVTVFAAKLGLMLRQTRHVWRHRDTVPELFRHAISVEAQRKSADYTCARLGLAISDSAVALAFVLSLLFGGGLDALHSLFVPLFEPGTPAHGLLLIAATLALGRVLHLPLSIYRIFRVDKRFGMSRMTSSLFVADLVRSAMLWLVVVAPALAVLLWFMGHAGELWWLALWLCWVAFGLFSAYLRPAIVAPLFNRFEPLEDETLKTRLEMLLKKCGFRAKGLYVMDGSRRSTHGNAYFAGMGRGRRIVLFDTLLARLAPAEIEAVLAHELGHFQLDHIRRRMLFGVFGSLVMVACFAWLAGLEGFLESLGVTNPDHAVKLLVLMLLAPTLSFPVTPFLNRWMMEKEYEADRFAVQLTGQSNLANALVKLYRNNASALTSDHWFSWFFDSHPSATHRIARLRAAAPTGSR